MLLRLIALLLLLAVPAAAQDRATLIADSLSIQGNDVLVASGGVEVFFQGQRLQASRVVYDRGADRLTITGPIRLTDDNGTLILADQASMSADLTEGLLTSARLVLDQQLQLAAAEIVRVGGRYTALNRVAASSCKVCRGNPTPLWEIRARRVVHDELEQQLYFDNAQFRVAGLPVFYIPRLRMPDPTLTRATGFLLPSLRSTSGLGTGLKLPYFIKIGDSRDLLLTPYLSTLGGRSVELRYRQAFVTGDIEITGAISRDDLIDDDLRGYLTGSGSFALPRGFTLSFDAIAVSDPAYLLDYSISDDDRLDSRITLNRIRRDEYFEARLIGFQSIREGESNATLPSVIGDFTFHRRFEPAILGGTGGFRFQTHGHYRQSTSGTDDDDDNIADGRDLGRISVRGDWRRNWALTNGMMISGLGEVTADIYAIDQDDIYEGTTSRLTGAAAVELRWPWVQAGDGAAQVIEPVVQLVWAPDGSDALPNEDSALVEFDEGNLFSLSRFAGSDAIERGSRANVGLSYLRVAPSGWTLGVTAGRVLRAEDTSQFSAGSGLAGVQSDWLLGWQLSTANGLDLTNRVVLGDDLDVTKGELRLDFAQDRYAVSAGYVFLVAEPAENRTIPTRELVLDASYDLSRNWTADLSSRYDFEADRATRAGLGVSFRNECVDFNLSVSRRFTSSTSVQPTTDFGLSVELLGFGGGTEAGPARTCRR